MACIEVTGTETYLGVEAIPKWQDMLSFMGEAGKWLPLVSLNLMRIVKLY